ncbi:MAG TPA: hypothetical protein VN516_08980 [Candidatus Baltobacteraceae bacterium]|nr:hypothetical protein [Candidatus Baltobacteraceae bacterium]
MDKHILDLIGYAGSTLIVISVMMSSIVRLRAINLLGAVVFATYGSLIHAYPVAALNGFIALVNAFYLLRMLQTKEYFRLLPLKPDSEYLPYFLNFYCKEIMRVVPDFTHQPSADQITLFILRDCKPAGVFIAEPEADGVWRVKLDFVIPRYRDLRIGKFLFGEQADFFRARGVREIVIAPRTKKFGAYLLKVGFKQREGTFRLRFAE